MVNVDRTVTPGHRGRPGRTGIPEHVVAPARPAPRENPVTLELPVGPEALASLVKRAPRGSTENVVGQGL